MLVGLGDGVGDCHDVANLPKECLFISLCFFCGKHFTLFQGMVLFVSVLLDMLVAKWKPIPCYHDAFSVGTPNWAFREKGWQMHCKTMFPPFFGTFLFGKQKNILLFVGAYFMGVPYW